jgi:hypothetical protein
MVARRRDGGHSMVGGRSVIVSDPRGPLEGQEVALWMVPARMDNRARRRNSR